MNLIGTQSKKTFTRNSLVLAFQILIFLLPYFVLGVRGKDIPCIVSFAINGILFLIGIFFAQKKHAFSLSLIYWIFMFFFMYFAPLTQYLLSSFPWSGAVTDEECFLANLLILLFNLCFAVGASLAKRLRVKGRTEKTDGGFFGSGFAFQKKGKIFVTVIVGLLTVYSFSRTGFLGIIVARTQAIQVFYSGNNSAVQLLVDAIIPAFIAYAVAEAAQGMMEKKERWIRFFILSLCLLICFFPTTIPRYKTAAIYGTVFLLIFPRMKKGSNFYWAFVLAMFFAFPLLNSFRRVISLEGVESVFQNGFLSSYVKGDYDAYRMLVSAIRYGRTTGFSWGYQLLGTLLFFVPRSLWPTKPSGSGSVLIQAEFGSSVFSNVSCPFIGEGYVNFGIPGVVLFAVLLGVFIRKVDERYWENAGEGRNIMFSPYLYLLFILFFVLRGDLLSGFAYTCGFMVTGYALKKVSKYL